MASSLIHMVVANEVNKKVKRDNDKILLGSIAPDLEKYLRGTKVNSHFLNNEETNIPNINRFLAKYQNKLDDDFVLGYFIHLCTDLLWFKYVIPSIFQDGYVNMLDGTKIKYEGREPYFYIYDDYTNMNKRLINDYHIDMETLNRKIPINDSIEEMSIEKLPLLIDKVKSFVTLSKSDKYLVLNLEKMKEFIQMNVKHILDELKKLNII